MCMSDTSDACAVKISGMNEAGYAVVHYTNPVQPTVFTKNNENILKMSIFGKEVLNKCKTVLQKCTFDEITFSISLQHISAYSAFILECFNPHISTGHKSICLRIKNLQTQFKCIFILDRISTP